MAGKHKKSSSSGKIMTLEQMDKVVAAWVASKKGQKDLEKMQELARKAAEKVISDAKVDAEQLRQAVTL